MENIYAQLLGLSSKIEHPNYYQLLMLQEGKVSPSKIEEHYKQQLQKIQNKSNNPKYKDSILFLKGELRKARVVLLDSQKRKQYDLSLHKQRQKSLQREIDLLKIKGYFTPEEAKYIRKRGEQLKIPRSTIAEILAKQNQQSSSPLWVDFKSSSSGQGTLVQKNKRQLSQIITAVGGVIVTMVAVGFYWENNKLQSQMDNLRQQHRQEISQILEDTAQLRQQLAVSKTKNVELLKQKKKFFNQDRQNSSNSAPSRELSSFPLQEVAPENEPPENQTTSSPPGYQQDLLAEMVHIPAGYFYMGSETGGRDQTPQRRVYLGEYYIAKHELTNREYRDFLRDTNHPAPYNISEQARPFNWTPYTKHPDFPAGKGDYPVVLVSWEDAMAYCRWLSEKTGYQISLPSEAQWEKAARGDNKLRYPWGNQPPDKGKYRANYDTSKDGYENLAPVGSFPEGASPYGCLDMAGNVYEWCLDDYDPRAYEKLSVFDPIMREQEPRLYPKKVLRGGSWFRTKDFLSTTYRLLAGADEQGIDYGFRYVVNNPP